MVLTGAQIVVECLKEQGVDTVFGYPGGTILNVYDALYQHNEEINHILTSHEQGGGTRGGRLRQSHRQGGRLSGNQRPGRDQSGDGNCDGLYGFGACGGDYL